MAHLDFEEPLVELEERIAALKALTEADDPEAAAIDAEIRALETQAPLTKWKCARSWRKPFIRN